MSLIRHILFSSFLVMGLTACNGSSSKNTNSNDEVPVPGKEDPLAAYAWHLENTGQTSFARGAGKAGEDIHIKEVHASGIKGNGVRIAISDTGVDLTHPDLSTNQLSSEHRDYSSDTSSQWHHADPYPIEHEGHGTAVTGLAAAEGWNGIGSRGVAPLAKYAGFLFVGNFHTNTSYETKLIDQIQGDFDIFNYSYGYSGCEFTKTSSTVIDAYKNGIQTQRNQKGSIYIQSAGNEYVDSLSYCYDGDTESYFGNTNTSEEHNHPYVILVASSNASGNISSYSTPGSGVWVTTLGGEFGTSKPAMISTDIRGCTYGLSESTSTASSFNKGSLSLNSRCDYTSIMNGTSSAAPVLSGVVALMLEAKPLLSWRDVKHILAKTSEKINYSTSAIPHPGGSSRALANHDYDYVYVKNAAGIDFSNTYGFGRVNAEAAVTMAKTYTSTLGTYQESGWYNISPNIAIPDKDANGATSTLNVSENFSIESVQIKFTTEHPFIGDLGLELISPAGTKSKLLLINSNLKDAGLNDFMMITNAFYEERSAGTWTLKVIDGAQNDTGHIQNWKIKVNGHQ